MHGQKRDGDSEITGIRRTENTNLHIKVNKTFYYSFFSIYAALVLQNVITLSVNLADNMMLGAYSETSLAGVAAVNQIQFVFQQILMALGDGLVIFCSQYWGKSRRNP